MNFLQTTLPTEVSKFSLFTFPLLQNNDMINGPVSLCYATGGLAS